MTGLFGQSAIQVALAISLIGIALLVTGARRQRARLIRAGYAAIYTTFGLLVVAMLAMVVALVTHDFSVGYVAQVGSRATPLWVTLVSVWSALEGSILFWAFLLTGYAALATYLNRREAGALYPYAGATLLGVAVFFLILLVGPANPFHEVFPVPADGPGPNPLLQNHVLMAVHPPLLYLGYVGLSVPFAFAVGAMLAGDGELAEDTWIRRTRFWTITSWGFLSAAIVAGMWWSYEVLGWGGYWAWDPVENASLMPWLTATAFLHSVIVQERRGMLRVWNLVLVVATFVLTILGTFLTRSGILSSVHAFTQGSIGYFFLGFIALVLLVSLALVAGCAGALRRRGALDAIISRESVFLANNLILSVVTFTVLLGTLFPLVAEVVRGVKVTVGAPFFNRMTIPLIVGLLFLMGVGPALPWRRVTPQQLRQQLRPPLVGAALGVAAAFGFGIRDTYALIAFGCGGFALAANLREFWTGTTARMAAHEEGGLLALGRLIRSSRHRYGGYVSHIGVILAALGIAASAASKIEHEKTLKAGQTMTVGGLDVRLDGVWAQEQPQRFAVGADLTLLRDGREIGRLTPRQNFYPSQEQPVPTPAVRSRLLGDVYVNLMAFAQDGTTATVRVLVEPLVAWIWLGGGIVCLGVVVALWPRRHRRARRLVEDSRRAATSEPTAPRAKRRASQDKQRRPVGASAAIRTREVRS